MKEKIAVYGSGIIGSCLATLTTGNGYETVVMGFSESGLERCRKTMEANWDLMIKMGVASEANKKAAMDLVTITNDVSKLEDRTFVFEAVAEEREIKESVYKTINEKAQDNVIIGSTTSSIDSSILASLTEKPEQLMIIHPFQPAHLNPLVEIVLHDKTSEESLERSKAVLKELKRETVTLKKSIPGFIVNRLAWTLFRESLNMLEDGVTTPEDINTAVKYAIGIRYSNIGLLEYYDDLNFEFADTVAKNIYPDLSQATDTQEIAKKHLESGEIGRKVKKGLFDWNLKDDDDYNYRKQAPWFETIKKWDLPE